MKLVNEILAETALGTYRYTGYRNVALFCLGPPLAILAVAAIGLWIAKGFR